MEDDLPAYQTVMRYRKAVHCCEQLRLFRLPKARRVQNATAGGKRGRQVALAGHLENRRSIAMPPPPRNMCFRCKY